jgi:hypothetical protein
MARGNVFDSFGRAIVAIDVKVAPGAGRVICLTQHALKLRTFATECGDHDAAEIGHIQPE